MFITEDNNGNKSIRLSRQEQGRLAYINIQLIKIQNLRAQGVPEEDIVKLEIELAGERRSLEESLKNNE